MPLAATRADRWIPGTSPGSFVHYANEILQAELKKRVYFRVKLRVIQLGDTPLRYLEQYPDGGYRYQRGVPAELVK